MRNEKHDTIEHRLSYMMNGVNVDTITAHGDAFTKNVNDHRLFQE